MEEIKTETEIKEKTADSLKERLFAKNKNVFETVCAEEIDRAYDYAKGYMAFLDNGKTERECVSEAVSMLEADGFTPYSFGAPIKAGDKFYYNNRGKSLAAWVVGSESLEKGVYISAAHIDSPRVDLKGHPLYEQDGLGYFKTHYYGGIKKYQWTTIPLALHGVVTRADGSTVTVAIGDNDDDPIFYITDLLPHLAGGQMGQTGANIIKGEQLNLLIGSRPYPEKTGEAVKLNIMKILNEKYGIVEDDFVTAELVGVPAMKARELGFDRSMIAAYGHDDRVCAYPSLTALMETKNPKHTVMAVLADKEEIGSEGNSGMQCAVYFDLIADMAKTSGVNEAVVRSQSKCLSADVNAAYDPNFGDVSEKMNNCFLNRGVVITKYTGSRGKSGSNDASAEFMGYVRTVLNKAGVIWQIGELGKVDVGGGGTVAKYIAMKNVDVVDLGVPVLSMHAPCEVVSKVDVYMTHKGIAAFFAE